MIKKGCWLRRFGTDLFTYTGQSRVDQIGRTVIRVTSSQTLREGMEDELQNYKHAFNCPCKSLQK